MGVDWGYISNNSLFIDQGYLGQGSRQFYIKPVLNSALTGYRNFMISIAKEIAKDVGSTVSLASIIADAQAMVNYETLLARRMTPAINTRDAVPRFNPMGSFLNC